MKDRKNDFLLQKERTYELIRESSRYHASFGALGGPTGLDFEAAEALTAGKINRLSQSKFRKIRRVFGKEFWFFEKSILKNLKIINSNEFVTFNQPFSGEDIASIKAGAIFLFSSKEAEKYYEWRLRRTLVAGVDIVHNEAGQISAERIETLSVFANTLKATDFWRNITIVLGAPLKGRTALKRHTNAVKVFAYIKKLNDEQIKASELYHSYFGGKGGPAGLKGALTFDVTDKHIKKFSKGTARIVENNDRRKFGPLDKSILPYLDAINKNPDISSIGSCSGDHAGQYVTREPVEPWVMLVFRTKEAEDRYKSKLSRLRGINIESKGNSACWGPGITADKNASSLSIIAKSKKDPLRFWDMITSVLTG